MSFVIAYILPFVSLLTMNSVIIHTLRRRPSSLVISYEQGQDQGQVTQMKQSERQIYTMLLLIIFGFLFLTTPSYVWLLCATFYKNNTSFFIAGNQLFSQIGVKTVYTNNAINFFLYVMSGKKFRSDLKKLFIFKKTLGNEGSVPNLPNTVTVSTNISD